MKGKTAVGDIQNDAAVFGADAEVGDFRELGSWSSTAVGRLHQRIYAFARTTQFPAGV